MFQFKDECPYCGRVIRHGGVILDDNGRVSCNNPKCTRPRSESDRQPLNLDDIFDDMDDFRVRLKKILEEEK